MNRTTKLLLAAVLATAALGSVTWALTGWRPLTAQAETAPDAPAAPQTLPLPFLNRPTVVDAPFGNQPLPTIDGYIAPGEYAGAGKVTFTGYGGYYDEVEVFFSHYVNTLYVAFEMPDLVNRTPSPHVSIFLDTNHDGGTTPQTDDFRFQVYRNAGVASWQGNGAAWIATPLPWTYGLTETMSGWSVELAIPFTAIGISFGTFQELGLALGNGGIAPQNYYWPQGVNPAQPSSWGSLVSSSDWGTFYWKPGPWEDYAPSGLPDFDQMQNPAWSFGPAWTHCGPVAAADSLWWFDSKFEALTGTSPATGAITDSYRLVRSYGTWDDHDPSNVMPLVDDLANNYFNTNDVWGGGTWQGTVVTDMHAGTLRYLRDHGLWDDYLVTLVERPTYQWVADEVMRSEDVILLLGFWEDQGGVWVRVGGHYVTVAGVHPGLGLIAFSDPFLDATEAALVSGRVLNGTLIPHAPIPGHPPFVHNDAGNISHDFYPVIATTSPGGEWGPDLYPWTAFIDWFFPMANVNPHPHLPTGPWMGGPIQVEVEYALAVSPYAWKASGEWEPDATDPVQGTWWPWADYAPNGVPDFDQKQDSWGLTPPGPPPWTYCGPVAAANSLWWFDAKFEPSPVGPPPVPIPDPPPIGLIPPSDNYPMVWTYGGWDDHDYYNVESGVAPPMPPPLPPWQLGSPQPPPAGGEFVDELAAYFDTDGQMTGGPQAGTVITDMFNGIELYLADRVFWGSTALPLRQGYVITMTQSPDFWWVAEEVEHSEDVILLLGFWQEQPSGSGVWVRLGGHYVTVPGVDKQGGLIAFSDPYYNGADFNWPYAYPAGQPIVMGRAADGWMVVHPPYNAHPPTVHNDAGNVSHDVYYAAPTNSPGGVWGPREYMETWDGTFEAQNGGQTGGWDGDYSNPVYAEVDWAIAVSPVADLWAGKIADPGTASPGETITFTIPFGNYGSLPAEGVVLTDTLPAGLVSPTFVGYWTSNGLTVTQRTGTTFTWDLPDLAWMEWGLITITAQVDPALSWPTQTVLFNVVEIDSGSLEQYQVTPYVAPIDNVATATVTVQTPDVAIVKTVMPTGTVAHGDWLTFTLTYSNTGAATASNVTITDVVPLSLTNVSYASAGASLTPVGSVSYTWQVADLPPGQGGIITITGQVDNTWPFISSLHNQASISASGDLNAANDQDDVTVPIANPKVYLPLVLRNY